MLKLEPVPRYGARSTPKLETWSPTLGISHLQVERNWQLPLTSHGVVSQGPQPSYISTTVIAEGSCQPFNSILGPEETVQKYSTYIIIMYYPRPRSEYSLGCVYMNFKIRWPKSYIGGITPFLALVHNNMLESCGNVVKFHEKYFYWYYYTTTEPQV